MGFLNGEFWPDDFWPDDYFPVYGDVDSVEELTFADMCTATLKITDGTTTVNLLDPDSGILLDSWIPALPGWKSGGVYTNNQLTDGRILQDAHRDNITESMTLNVRNTSMDAVIRDSQNLRRLLEKAVQYWTTNWQNDPVWIEAKGKEETNTRYAVIVNYATPSDVNPYAQPFAAMQSSPYLMNGLTLVLEHQPWTGNEPGTGTAVQLNTEHTYNTLTLGQEATTTPVILDMRHAMADITHVFVYDASAASFSANKHGGALPYDLLPAVPAVGDILYIGINSALANSGPFGSAIFDLGVAPGGTYAIEYWNGAAWASFGGDGLIGGLLFHDYTEGFLITGVNGIFFGHPSNWATTAVNGVTGYWIRFRLTAAAPANPPTQQNRQIYSAIQPFAEIVAAQVGGDIPALAKFDVLNMYDTSIGSGAGPDNVIFATRSVDRGDDFTAYINLSDEQNPTGITVSAAAGSGSIAAFIYAPTGRAYFYNPAAYPGSNTVTVTIDSAIADQYVGRYYAMLRGVTTSGVSGDSTISVVAGATNEGGAIKAQYMSVGGIDGPGSSVFFYTLELGTIDIPYTVSPKDIEFEITITSTGGTPDVYLIDLILVPVDEYVARIDGVNIVAGEAAITSIAHQKNVSDAYVYDVGDAKLIPGVTNIPGGLAILQNNKAQKVWVFSTSPYGYYSPAAYVNTIFSLSAQVNPRYLSMRGDR